MSEFPPRGIEKGLAGCHTCCKVSPETEHHCPRCGTPLHTRKPNSVQRTMALLLAASALYVPANALPIMTVSEFGDTEPTTIVQGMVDFWKSGAYPIALVIFTASIFIPLLKILALLWLCAAASGKVDPSPKTLSKVYWMTEVMGRWSMVDIFVVAILVAMVQLGSLMTVVPGPAALAFGGVVILTMFSAMSFDPRLLWDQVESKESDPQPQ